MTRARECVCVHSGERATHSGFPAEDVTVETEPVLGQIQAALQQDVFLQGAGIVWWGGTRKTRKLVKQLKKNIIKTQLCVYIFLQSTHRL